MYFQYNGTRDRLKIEWRDQCMKLEVVDKNYGKIPLCFGAHLFAFNSPETELHKQVSLAEIHFMLLLCDNSPAYEISYLQVSIYRQKTFLNTNNHLLSLNNALAAKN